jgi:hypothetical protein
MRTIGAIALCLLIACGGSKPPQEDDDTLPDPGTGTPGGTGGEEEELVAENELQRRQFAACESVIPRLTACAVEDARQKLSPEQFEKEQIEETAPIHTREYLKKCKRHKLSSRQVRVYEVCDKEEAECASLIACLDNLKPTAEEEP